MNEQYAFDSKIERIYRAIRGMERTGFSGDESEALNVLQVQFSNYSRDELKEIYKKYGDINDFKIQ